MIGCDVFRDRIQERLDGELGEAHARELNAHLAACVPCRELAEDLSTIAAGLRDLPEHHFPDRALEEVFDRTLCSPSASQRSGRFPAFLRWATVAAATAAGIVLVLTVPKPNAPDRPTPAEIARAQRDVRIVLSLTARVLNQAERAASDRVLAGEVAPALRRVPIRWRALQPEVNP